MRRTSLGRSGLGVSSLVLGTLQWGGRTDVDEARAMLRTYLEAGGDLLDTAHGYAAGASEQVIGGLLAELGRGEVRVCTKAGISRSAAGGVVDVSRGSLMGQLEESLRRLGTDHVDLWLAHAWSDEIPLEETLSALEWAARTGRARYVGVCNYGGWQLARAVSLAERAQLPIVADQVEYSLLERVAEHEVVPAAQALGVGLMAWAPLGGGVLAGRYRRTTPADSRAASPELAHSVGDRLGAGTQAIVESVATAARGLDASMTAVSLAWLTSRSAVSCAVVGPRTDAQLGQLLAEADLAVPEQVLLALDEVSQVSL